MAGSQWIPVEGASDLPPHRLERVMSLGAISTPELSPAEREGPQAYLVAQGSATDELPVHFHTVDQFQYFAHGRGVVGAHDVGHGTVHFSDALTPYGPLRPGAPGMSYLTLRAVHDGGVRYMPQSKDDLKDRLGRSPRPAGDRRNVTVELADPVEPARWHHLRDDPDGLRISVVDLPPDAEVDPLVVGPGGAYAVVVSGVLAADGERFEPAALRWLGAAEVLTVAGGPAGVRIAVLQYPARATAQPD